MASTPLSPTLPSIRSAAVAFVPKEREEAFEEWLEPESGTEWVAKSMRLNPYHPNWVWNILGRTLHSADRFEDAIRAFKRISTPNFWNLAYLAACSAEVGDMAAAETYAAQLRAARPDFTIG